MSGQFDLITDRGFDMWCELLMEDVLRVLEIRLDGDGVLCVGLLIVDVGMNV